MLCPGGTFITCGVIIYKGSIQLWISNCIISRQVNTLQRHRNTRPSIQHHDSRQWPLSRLPAVSDLGPGKHNKHEGGPTEHGMMDEPRRRRTTRLLSL